jgi:hypothetical protein
MDSERHRVQIDKVIAATKPRFHFHGHMHTKYDWVNTLSHGDSAFRNEPWDGPETRTIGLEAFTDHNSWGVLDTEQDLWYWPDDLENALLARQLRKAEREEDSKALLAKDD